MAFEENGPSSYAQLPDEALITLLREGDSAAEEELYERYKNVVRAKARTYFLMGGDKEDIIQEGMIGLYKAARDFQPERAGAFSAFAELCITRQIITAIKSATRQKHIPLNSYVSLNKPLSSGEPGRTLGDILSAITVSDPEEMLINRERYDAMSRKIEALLSRLERDVLLLYLEGRPYVEIAEILGRSPKAIDNALQRVKRKLETTHQDG